VQRLTGITDGDVAGAPSLAVLYPQLQSFLGNDPLVGHNILTFDTVFLQRAGLLYQPAVYDTQDLAPLLLPGLPEYGLAALADHFQIDFQVRHRALADAEAARELFLRLQETSRRLPLDVLSSVAQWLTATSWPWRAFFERSWEFALGAGASTRPFHLSAPSIPPPLSPEKQTASVATERVLKVMSSAERHPQIFPLFDHREEQQRMAAAVNAAMNEGKRLLVEAGTGTGKSLAYLIPAACQAMANGRRVLVSTATINLQEQLSKKDVPALQTLMAADGSDGTESPGSTADDPVLRSRGFPASDACLRACQLKGRRNYLCLRQFDALRNQPLASDAEALLASRILIWLCSTQTGDRAELRLTGAEEAIWHRLSADNLQCTPDSSPYITDGTCFLQRARRQAEASHIVVVNHALLLSGTAAGGNVLPSYEHLVIDEAHHLEDEATRQFGFTAGEKSVSDVLERCEALPRQVQALLQSLTVALGPYDQLAGAVAAVRDRAAAARPRLLEFATRCIAFLQEHCVEQAEHEQRLHVTRATRAQPDWPGVEMAWENLRLVSGELCAGLERLLSLLTGQDAFGLVNQELVVAETANLLGETQGLCNGFAAAIEQDDPQRIVWFERERSEGGIVISWVPLSVNDLLREMLYADRRSVVLTGASLRTQAGPAIVPESRPASLGFQYIQERLGLEDADTLLLGSPFDYRRAALVLLPRDIPEPSWPDYLKVCAQAIIDLARASQGRALVLFTSHSGLRAAHAIVEEPLRREGIQALAQGIDGSPRQLVRALQSSPNTVILGTASFWEGVDIVGEALSLLIMARLPFAVPTEPVFAARSALYDDPFGQYAVPQAVLRFKQGFGRLIRSKTDRGVLVVLDRRILSKSYASAFIDSLPGCTVRQVMLREMPDQVEQWLAAPVASAE